MNKLRSKPPTTDVEKFISEAENRREVIPPDREPAVKKEHKVYPWQDPRLRDDVAKVYNLRLPEAYLLKLKYIAEHSPQSMQRFCLDVLLPEIDKKIKELT